MYLFHSAESQGEFLWEDDALPVSKIRINFLEAQKQLSLYYFGSWAVY
jgi:hypothetical protein